MFSYSWIHILITQAALYALDFKRLPTHPAGELYREVRLVCFRGLIILTGGVES
jgi:hypothetical protein